LIVTHPMGKVATSLVVALLEKRERNTRRAARLPAHVKKEVRVSLGVKKQKGNLRSNGTHRIICQTSNQRRVSGCS